MTGRPKALLELTSDESEQLERWVRRRTSAQALALRSRIVLACGTGLTNKQVAARLGCQRSASGGPGSCNRGWTAWSTSQDRGANPRSPPNRSRTSSLRRWNQLRRMPRIGPGRRWPNAADCPRLPSGGSGKGSASNRTSQMGSNCPPTRSSWTRSTTSSGSTSIPPKPRWCSASMRSHRSRRWVGRSRRSR